MPPVGYTGPVPHSSKNLSSLAPESGEPESVSAEPLPVVSAPVTNAMPPALSLDPARHQDKTLISAQQMHSDSETGIVTASGKVEVVYNDYVLHADKITYNQQTDVVVAEGNVALLMPTGEVVFSDRQEVTGDMREAFAQNVGILFPDNARMAARTIRRYDERYMLANKALYTACNVCRENPDVLPLWQVRAKSITHDNVEHKIHYHDATLDFAGVPIAYTPYLAGPDPTVKRKQGFLPLAPGISPNIGDYVKIPYYFDIAPDKDMTLTPTLSTEDKFQIATQYRQRFERAKLLLDGSVTRAELIEDTGENKGQQWRGHLFGTYLANIDNIWRAGADVQWTSDKSYLQRYNISNIDQTVSRAYAEAFKGRDYLALNSYYFQDLRAGTDVAEPVVLPSATFSALGDPGSAWGGRWSFDGNTLITYRDNTAKSLTEQGPDTRRLSLNAGWQRQFISDTGLEATVSGLARTDSYWANNVISADASQAYDRALFTRPFAQANVVTRYPLGRSGDGYQHLVEPILAFTLAPDVRRITKQPLEDSFDIEFDETNLFAPNRFTGSDLVEGGSRVTYGLRNALTADNGAHLDLFGGQSYNFSRNPDVSTRSGLSGHASDYVGRIDFSPAPWFYLNYGFRLAQENLSFERQDASMSIGEPVFKPTLRYIQAYQRDAATNLYNQVRQVTFGLTSNFTKYWTFTGSHTHSFDPQPGPRESSVALTYVDECFAFGVGVTHNETNRADISSGTSVAFHFYLKDLGGLHTDSVSNITFPAEFRQTE